MRSTVDGSFAVAVTGRMVSVSSASSPSSVPRPDDDALPPSALAAIECERAFLHHKPESADVAGTEQHLARMHVAALGADRENAQRSAAEQLERRHPFEEGDIVLNGHAN